MKLLLIAIALFLIGCSQSSPTTTATPPPSNGYPGGNPQGTYGTGIVVNTNNVNYMKATVAGNSTGAYSSIPLTFEPGHNSVKITMLSSYVEVNSTMKIELWGPNSDLIFSEDFIVSGSVNRVLRVQTNIMPVSATLNTSNYVGSMEVTMAPCSI